MKVSKGFLQKVGRSLRLSRILPSIFTAQPACPPESGHADGRRRKASPYPKQLKTKDNEFAPRERLPAYVFDLPVQELRRGYRSDVYFWREKVALENSRLHPVVTMQVFQKHRAVLCGTDEALAVLKLASGHYRDRYRAYKLFDRYLELKRESRKLFLLDRNRYLQVIAEKNQVTGELDELWEGEYDKLKVESLFDGQTIEPWESVMHITGDASVFAHLETIYLGVLARRTKIATNVRKIVEAANGKMILYFPARFDHWAVQGGDGYAAQIGGAGGVSTDAQAEWWGGKGGGTVPHALIAAMGGDTVRAVMLFADAFPEERLVALVDFDNDCVNTALLCARALGRQLWGVRLDTSENLVDKSIVPEMGSFKPTGVIPELVYKTRAALDKEGFQHVKIIASGGFDAERIAQFENIGTPIDAYGVGSALLKGAFDFTADVVLLEGKPCAKFGRKHRPNPRLQKVEPADQNSIKHA
jgi:nicotinate phosphoribosyltransferase